MTQKERMDIIEKNLNKYNTKLDKILFYFENDKTTGRKGFYEELESLKEIVNNLVDERKIFNAQLKVWSLIGGGVATGLFLLLKFIITKTI